MKTLEQYFHENMDRDVVDFSVRARSFGSGRVGFYIHPDGRDGETLDFMVQGNTLALPAQNIDGFGFGIALDILKKGGKVRRTGWNGKGMWLGLQQPHVGSEMTLPYIYMLTADGKYVPWLASQTDMLSTDWGVLE